MRLFVPPEPRVVPDGVFDAWSWCESDHVELLDAPLAGQPAIEPPSLVSPGRRLGSRLEPSALVSPERRLGSRLERGRIEDGTNPSDLLFVMHAECTFLPRERAYLHERSLGDAWILAPYAIDDATDELFARGVRPRDVLSLYAPSLPALVWGLHDWAHFHNHGPFDDPPMTELQCDLVALAWVRTNADALALQAADLDALATDLEALAASRFGGQRPDDLLALFRTRR